MTDKQTNNQLNKQTLPHCYDSNRWRLNESARSRNSNKGQPMGKVLYIYVELI